MRNPDDLALRRPLVPSAALLLRIAPLIEPASGSLAARVTETPAAPSRRARAFALYPFLFAAYPVLFLWSQNLGEVSIGGVLPVLLLVLGITAAGMAVLTLVFR